MIFGRILFIILSSHLFLICFSATFTPPNVERTSSQAVLNDNVDLSMSGGRPSVSMTSSNTLWSSSDNKTSLVLHTNAKPSDGWAGVLELKRPGGGGSLGIKRPPEGGRPIVSATGNTMLYESNGTSVGINGAVDSSGNRDMHMSIKRP